MVFILPAKLGAPSEYEQRKHKHLYSEIVKVDIMIIDDERQQPIQVIGSGNLF